EIRTQDVTLHSWRCGGLELPRVDGHARQLTRCLPRPPPPALRRLGASRSPPPPAVSPDEIEAQCAFLASEREPHPPVDCRSGCLQRPPEFLRVIALLEGQSPALLHSELLELPPGTPPPTAGAWTAACVSARRSERSRTLPCCRSS